MKDLRGVRSCQPREQLPRTALDASAVQAALRDETRMPARPRSARGAAPDRRSAVANRLRSLGIVLVVALTAGACAAGRAFRQGEQAARAGDLDSAVAAYRRALQADPDNPRYKIALERAMQAASRAHLERAQRFEQQGQLEAALGEYRLASEYDPSNRGIASKVAQIEKAIRDRLEAARPPTPGQQLRAAARA